MHWTHIVLYILGIGGVLLNNHRRRECFYIWLLSNLGWMIVDIQAGLNVQALLFMTYFCLSVHGLWKWKYKTIEK
jgi:nicotinamide riboside transporter PnuC